MLRTVARRLNSVHVRTFHNTSFKYAASVFKMPAMSPTMTEGGIIAWKVKPGDSFNAGDVILEVETDKANIDVEAADDGKMWEIIENEGAKNVPVGKAIAITAEVDDDLNALERPNIEESQPSKNEEQPKESAKPASKDTETKSSKNDTSSKSKSKSENKSENTVSSGSSVLQAANSNQKFSPAVELLLHENNITKDEALSKIKASGPNGRILKGDVLSYLGKIQPESIESITKFIKSRQHLDLSNIVLAKPEKTAAAETDASSKSSSAKPEKPKPSNILSVELTSILGEGVPKAKFKYSFESAIASAIQHTYAQRFPQYATSPTASSIYDKYDVFEDLISASVTKNRFEVYDVKFKFYDANTSSVAKGVSSSAFDELLGLSEPVQYLETGSPSNVGVSFKIKFDAKLPDSKQFVEFFENSLLSQIPANKLKITS
ncbi:pyridoxine biosynthesis protein [Lodderomyces elongisporus]|uniref:pyridoxine biosynthesis protein n=1 Tax=Lodderomyces elongisporus TaxID=36914 RepID=UPI00291F0D12|nr:pyridoxine biosynthesis protein [Lodderomyces elongisporus]WLF79215.1 pyridoxine biosynthesis protein [Lodderomyces elongisporus]